MTSKHCEISMIRKCLYIRNFVFSSVNQENQSQNTYLSDIFLIVITPLTILHIPKSYLVAFKRPINGPKLTQIEVSTSLFHYFHQFFGEGYSGEWLGLFGHMLVFQTNHLRNILETKMYISNRTLQEFIQVFDGMKKFVYSVLCYIQQHTQKYNGHKAVPVLSVSQMQFLHPMPQLVGHWEWHTFWAHIEYCFQKRRIRCLTLF